MPSATSDRLEPFDVVVVPFPFSEKEGSKRRPALVLSTAPLNSSGHIVMAMITTRSHHPWPGDLPIHDLEAAGLPSLCMVRLKLFTLDNRLIIRRLGRLSDDDIARMRTVLDTYLAT